MKSLKLYTFVSALLFSASSLAVCQLPLKDSDSRIFPSMITPGGGWSGGFVVTNISDVPVKITLEQTDTDGNGYTPYSVSYTGHFNASNTPLNLIDGATLQPGQLGTLNIADPATAMINIGYINWEADSCIKNALLVTFYNQYNASSKYSSGRFHLNNGLPF